ncbi:hypothetical protein HYC85_018795 [Camellia sinensis]|uniref:Uncharacterized protein n=1 Tax=Camellia sinensis TaxID=4442 RepID=A0A7J7GZ54_CAMSI|nr:hypothetical protein HYC85_018795 [Camellia sinensis]
MPTTYSVYNLTNHDCGICSNGFEIQNLQERQSGKKECFPKPQNQLFSIIRLSLICGSDLEDRVVLNGSSIRYHLVVLHHMC